ncbi:uncharacterized protein GGS22DRAFT_162591 [Annulohypoxylon maeteangense]|uniref:uncharacterized protein n=1 Tax=Annulohypoxylon maeteangense TaxID=1927788 RepID=UPI002008069D|nr:uncharacterized protein GGS22DRAFT_162591 [Annulohypoxylon maeteangense]KAI0885046.1 hypothetical protein GGS22DRAFT_162591 [Annulohypoxylon maeteangense]
METKSYTSLDRGNVLKTLESRLSASHSTVQGPQVQLFRVNSPSPTASPNPTMPHWRPDEQVSPEIPRKDACTTTPSEHLIQSYNKRIQVMQAVINQLRSAGKDRQDVELDLKKTREELDRANARINDLEAELEQGAGELKTAIKQRDAAIEHNNRYHIEAEEADKKCRELEHINRRLMGIQEGCEYACNDVIRIHNVIWGSQPIYDESLNKRLLEYASQGFSFTTTCDFINYDVRPGERRTLVVAYSKFPDGPMRWLVVDESHGGEFDLR